MSDDEGSYSDADPDVLALRRTPEHAAHGYPSYLDQDGDEWLINRVATGEPENDACERCGVDISDKAFSVFLYGSAVLRCSDCVRFIDGAQPPQIEDR